MTRIVGEFGKCWVIDLGFEGVVMMVTLMFLQKSAFERSSKGTVWPWAMRGEITTWGRPHWADIVQGILLHVESDVVWGLTFEVCACFWSWKGVWISAGIYREPCTTKWPYLTYSSYFFFHRNVDQEWPVVDPKKRKGVSN